MKTAHTVYPIKRDDCYVDLPPDVASCLQVSAGTVVDAAFVLNAPSNDPEDPQVSIVIASPVRRRAWGRLIRVALVLPPVPGSLNCVMEALVLLGLPPLHVETIQGLKHAATELANLFVVLEVPRPPHANAQPEVVAAYEALERVLDGQGTDGAAEKLNTAIGSVLQTLLSEANNARDEAERASAKAKKALEESENASAKAEIADSLSLLNQRIASLHRKIDSLEQHAPTVAWLAPLKTLNELARQAENSMEEKKPSPWKAAQLELTSSEAAATHLELEEVRSLESAVRTFPRRPLAIPQDAPLGVSFLRWHEELDSHASSVIDTSRHLGKGNLAAVVSVDHDERILSFEFVSLTRVILADFEIWIPAGTHGHRWLAWITAEVRDAGGNILACHARGRQGRRWANVAIKAIFPFTATPQSLAPDAALASQVGPTPDVEKIQRILGCFRALKGKEIYAPPSVRAEGFKRLVESLEAESQAEPSTEGRSSSRASTDSLLHSVRLRYVWRGPLGPDYRDRFSRCGFNFTRPLTLQTHSVLFPQVLLREDSRLRMAARIHERLVAEGESIVLVGAHRSGKTSLMNMVCDFVNGSIPDELLELDKVLQQPAIALRVNAAITPPHLLFLEILGSALRQREAIARTLATDLLLRGADNAGSPAAGSTAAVRRKILEIKLDVVKSFLESLQSIVNAGLNSVVAGLDLEAAMPLLAATERALDGDKRAPPRLVALVNQAIANGKGVTPELLKQIKEALEEPTRDASRAGTPGRPAAPSTMPGRASANPDGSFDQRQRRRSIHEERARDLRNALLILRDTAAQLSMRVGSKTVTPSIVIAVDEIMESTAWGGAWALPSWRHAIESHDYRNLRWLFASSRPIAEVTVYSPLSNALREYNLGPLTEREANYLVENMQSRASDGKLKPTLTFGARQYILAITGSFPYLLQVVCTHVYEQSISEHVPVVSESLVRHIVKVRILAELGDFFEAQWRSLESETLRHEVETCLSQWPYLRGSTDAVYRVPRHKFSPALRKELERRGLGNDSIRTFVVPLFVMWLQDRVTGAKSDRDPAPPG